MTALKPVENRHVVGVVADKYPSNKTCAHPECKEPVQLRPDGTPTVHHCFPRSQIGNDSYFVEVMEDLEIGEISEEEFPKPIPHAVGLCGSGTTGHHGDVEEHRAWIKLEDGVWNWYSLTNPAPEDVARWVEETDEHENSYPIDTWELVGPLNPQPGSVDSKPKRAKFKGEAKRKRVNWQVRVPADSEDGAGILDDLIGQCAAKLVTVAEAPEDRPTYYTLVDVLQDWMTS